MKRILAGVLLLFLGVVLPARGGEMKTYDSRYYIIHTDIDADAEREAAIRMTKMAEEYHERTKSFAGVIRQKLPFYLYKSSDDYYANGGLPGSAGVFIYDGTSGKLMAIAGDHTSAGTWHVIQHEGFHQFAHAVIGGTIPTWLNEGLAEYFGEAIFTGDGFITGIVPPNRLARLKTEINDGKVKSIRDIMFVSPEQWAHEMSTENYDQAWSMVHFLVHGDGGKYQQPFAACIREISAHKPFDRAWLDTLGTADGFEQRWKAYWLAQPESPTADLYARATVSILTSFLARATAEKQTFDSFAAFRAAADADQLKINPDDWLPPALLAAGTKSAGPSDAWTLHPAPKYKLPTLSVQLKDGSTLTGVFSLHGNRVLHVGVEVDDLAKILTDAQALADAGKKDQAKTMLRDGLAHQPKSTAAAEARKILAGWK
jgi:hypothetical protein